MTQSERNRAAAEAQAARARVFQARLEAGQRVLKTEDGQHLVALLEGKFDGKLLGNTPEQTIAKVGAREVVRYLRWLRDRKEP